MISKLLPDVYVAWRNVRLGAALTSLLFTLVILLWVYYSAQSSFSCQVHQGLGRRRGAGAVPTEAAVALTEEARAEQGMARGQKRGAP